MSLTIVKNRIVRDSSVGLAAAAGHAQWEGPVRAVRGTVTKMSNRVVYWEASHAGSWYTVLGP